MKSKGMFLLLTEKRGGKCSSSDPQQQETMGLFSPPAFTLTSFILAIRDKLGTMAGSQAPQGSEICFVNFSLPNIKMAV